jgi:hypothetical protein
MMSSMALYSARPGECDDDLEAKAVAGIALVAYVSCQRKTLVRKNNRQIIEQRVCTKVRVDDYNRLSRNL